MDLIIRNGTVVSHKGRQIADVAVKDGKIFAVGYLGDTRTPIMKIRSRAAAAAMISTPVRLRPLAVEPLP